MRPRAHPSPARPVRILPHAAALTVCATLTHLIGCGSSPLAEHHLIRRVVFEPEPGDGHAIRQPRTSAWDAEPRPRRPLALVLAPDDD
ncbi:MAG: hypothetical protein ACF8SC_01385 [Phycisphaerales bacterium JB037]